MRPLVEGHAKARARRGAPAANSLLGLGMACQALPDVRRSRYLKRAGKHIWRLPAPVVASRGGAWKQGDRRLA